MLQNSIEMLQKIIKMNQISIKVIHKIIKMNQISKNEVQKYDIIKFYYVVLIQSSKKRKI